MSAPISFYFILKKQLTELGKQHKPGHATSIFILVLNLKAVRPSCVRNASRTFLILKIKIHTHPSKEAKVHSESCSSVKMH